MQNTRRNMRNMLRSTEEHLMRLAVQADQGYTPLKLNDQNVEDDVRITQEDLHTWKIPKLYKKVTGG